MIRHNAQPCQTALRFSAAAEVRQRPLASQQAPPAPSLPYLFPPRPRPCPRARCATTQAHMLQRTDRQLGQPQSPQSRAVEVLAQAANAAEAQLEASGGGPAAGAGWPAGPSPANPSAPATPPRVNVPEQPLVNGICGLVAVPPPPAPGALAQFAA